MRNVFRLRLGASLHFLIALGHFICLFFLEEAFKAYGILYNPQNEAFRLSITNRIISYNEMYLWGTPPPQNIFDRLTPVFT